MKQGKWLGRLLYKFEFVRTGFEITQHRTLHNFKPFFMVAIITSLDNLKLLTITVGWVSATFGWNKWK